MREYIIADNQDISKAGMMFLLSRQKDVSVLLEADNKAELIQQLRLYPQAVVILDYTLFDFAGADELIVLQERFKEADWILFSDELSIPFLRQVLFSSMAFGVVMKDNSKEEIMTALQCASRKQRYICNHVSNLLLSGSVPSAPSPATTEDHLLTQTEKNILIEIAPPKEYLPEAGSQQCTRGYQVCDACRDCRLGGILYLRQPAKDRSRRKAANGQSHHFPHKLPLPDHKRPRTDRAQCPATSRKTRYGTDCPLPESAFPL